MPKFNAEGETDACAGRTLGDALFMPPPPQPTMRKARIEALPASIKARARHERLDHAILNRSKGLFVSVRNILLSASNFAEGATRLKISSLHILYGIWKLLSMSLEFSGTPGLNTSGEND